MGHDSYTMKFGKIFDITATIYMYVFVVFRTYVFLIADGVMHELLILGIHLTNIDVVFCVELRENTIGRSS